MATPPSPAPGPGPTLACGIALGSNLGDRLHHLQRGLTLLLEQLPGWLDRSPEQIPVWFAVAAGFAMGLTAAAASWYGLERPVQRRFRHRSRPAQLAFTRRAASRAPRPFPSTAPPGR